ncbi:MAG: polysaccharide biosynthesis/export family protein [Alphaproteobacteria bacterium]
MRVEKVIRSCSVVVGIAVLSACAPTRAPVEPVNPGLTISQPAGPGRNFPIGPGDTIEIAVFGHEELSSEYQVTVDGVIALPLVGEVLARGRTIEELEQEISDRLRGDVLVDPKVTIRVVDYRPVMVIGGVMRPGSQEYVPGMTILGAIAAAGGHSPEALQNWPPIIIRSADPTAARQDARLTDAVLPGDIVEIPFVRRPKPFAF